MSITALVIIGLIAVVFWLYAMLKVASDDDDMHGRDFQ